MAPPIFLFLGLLGIFNVFQIGDYFEKYEISSNDGKVQDVLIDSRSQIYSDVFSQLNSDNALVFGLGASGKTKTHLTDIVYTDFDKVYKEGRRGTESGILNYIQFGGLLGGFFYFFLFLKGSYLAFYKSKNRFMVLFGTWVAFKAMNSFIEDSNIFSVSSVFLFLCIGLCYNEYLRNLSDEEVRALFRIKKLPIT
jgi:O-antigen ligase